MLKKLPQGCISVVIKEILFQSAHNKQLLIHGVYSQELDLTLSAEGIKGYGEKPGLGH